MNIDQLIDRKRKSDFEDYSYLKIEHHNLLNELAKLKEENTKLKERCKSNTINIDISSGNVSVKTLSLSFNPKSDVKSIENKFFEIGNKKYEITQDKYELYMNGDLKDKVRILFELMDFDINGVYRTYRNNKNRVEWNRDKSQNLIDFVSKDGFMEDDIIKTLRKVSYELRDRKRYELLHSDEE